MLLHESDFLANKSTIKDRENVILHSIIRVQSKHETSLNLSRQASKTQRNEEEDPPLPLMCQSHQWFCHVACDWLKVNLSSLADSHLSSSAHLGPVRCGYSSTCSSCSNQQTIHVSTLFGLMVPNICPHTFHPCTPYTTDSSSVDTPQSFLYFLLVKLK